MTSLSAGPTRCCSGDAAASAALATPGYYCDDAEADNVLQLEAASLCRLLWVTQFCTGSSQDAQSFAKREGRNLLNAG